MIIFIIKTSHYHLPKNACAEGFTESTCSIRTRHPIVQTAPLAPLDLRVIDEAPLEKRLLTPAKKQSMGFFLSSDDFKKTRECTISLAEPPGVPLHVINIGITSKPTYDLLLWYGLATTVLCADITLL